MIARTAQASRVTQSTGCEAATAQQLVGTGDHQHKNADRAEQHGALVVGKGVVGEPVSR